MFALISVKQKTGHDKKVTTLSTTSENVFPFYYLLLLLKISYIHTFVEDNENTDFLSV